jgi:hypothetical protein
MTAVGQLLIPVADKAAGEGPNARKRTASGRVEDDAFLTFPNQMPLPSDEVDNARDSRLCLGERADVPG